MKLKGETFTGFEHHVWLDPETGVVSKIPSKLGEFWQVMTPAAVERDLEIMDRYDIPTVETRVYGPQTVSYTEGINGSARQTRAKAKYVLKQPLIKPARAMTYADLLHTRAHRDILLELMLQREEIKQKHHLGLDLLGGQGFRLVRPALDPNIRAMRADVGNLLIAEADIQTNGSWAEHSRKPEGFVAKKDKALLCDTRLMPIGEVRGWKDRLLAPVMERNCQFQDAALWATLEGLGVNKNIVRADERYDTSFKRLVRRLALHATPKMIAGAEAYA